MLALARRAALLSLLIPVPLSAMAATGGYDAYWGDLHGHTMEAPVVLTPQVITSFILHARDAAHLDFVALTEKDFDLSDAEWDDVRSKASQYTSSGSFVAFSAFEWGDDGFDAFGHRGVYYVSNSQPLFRSDVSTSDHVSELIERVYSSTDGLTGVAHPDLSNFATDWDYFDGLSDRFAEIYSRHGHFEDGDRGIQQALAQGYRFGFAGVSDTRSGTPGSHGLTTLFVGSLRKSDLRDAIHARRMTATTGARILLWYSADGREMGEEFSSSDGPTLSIECTPTAPVVSLEVLKNNVVVKTFAPTVNAVLPSSTQRTSTEPADLGWTKASVNSHEWEETGLENLEAPGRTSNGLRYRQSYDLDVLPERPILRTNLDGDYRIYVNGELLVDTHQFGHDDPHAPHDCLGDDAFALAGTPERFRQLGFYDLQALGVKLHQGENIIALEYEPSGPGSEEPRYLKLESVSAMQALEYTWADNSFTGPSFYYVRVTQADGHQAWASPIWVDRLAPDTTPPAAPHKLRANRDGADVFLDWPKVTKDAEGNIEKLAFYRIFRGTTAGFEPDRLALTNQIDTSTRSRYRDRGAVQSGTNYFYRVVAVDAASNESIGHSNLAYKIHRPLAFHDSLSNIHWISLPWESINSTAQELARDLNVGDSGPCTKIMRWDVGTQSPQSWVFLGGQWVGTNFPLTMGQSVAITIRSDLDVVLVGAHDNGSATRLTPNPSPRSLNWISVPINTPYFFASNLVNDINGGIYPSVVSRIVRFAPNQVYQTYQWTGSIWSGTNFILMPGDGYAVEVKTVMDWVPGSID